MTPDLIIALFAFAFVGSVTPGPNNVMLMASGANFGLRRTWPHVLGVALGFAAMTGAVGLGVAGVLAAQPALRGAMAVLAVAYMLRLAWKILRAAAPEGARAGARPMSFLQAAAFQWVNPKAWALALTMVGGFAPGRDAGSVAAVMAVVAAAGLPCSLLWAAAGQALRGWLAGPGRLRAFNAAMAALLVLSVWPVVAPLLATAPR